MGINRTGYTEVQSGGECEGGEAFGPLAISGAPRGVSALSCEGDDEVSE